MKRKTRAFPDPGQTVDKPNGELSEGPQAPADVCSIGENQNPKKRAMTLSWPQNMKRWLT